MDFRVEENHLKFATNLSLQLAYKAFNEGNTELSIHHAKEAVKAMKALQTTKKPTDTGMSIGGRCKNI